MHAHAHAHANACVAMPCPFPRPRPPLAREDDARERVGNAHTHIFFLLPPTPFATTVWHCMMEYYTPRDSRNSRQ